MATKKRAAAKQSKPRKRSSKRLEKAVPPSDNPLLRYQAYDPVNMGGGADEPEMARLRMEAIRDTQEMATTETPGDVPSTGDDNSGDDASCEKG